MLESEDLPKDFSAANRIVTFMGLNRIAAVESEFTNKKIYNTGSYLYQISARIIATTTRNATTPPIMAPIGELLLSEKWGINHHLTDDKN